MRRYKTNVPWRTSAWLIDAEVPASRRNCEYGHRRTITGSGIEATERKAINAGLRAYRKAKARGENVQDRFHVLCGGVWHNVSVIGDCEERGQS